MPHVTSCNTLLLDVDAKAVVRIADIPSGRTFRNGLSVSQADDRDARYCTFMLDGGYTLQLGIYVQVKNLCRQTYEMLPSSMMVEVVDG